MRTHSATSSSASFASIPSTSELSSTSTATTTTTTTTLNGGSSEAINKEGIKIYARLRRIMPWESDEICCRCKDDRTIIHRGNSMVKNTNDINVSSTQKAYEFTKVFDAHHENETIFQEACIPLLENVLQGFNAIFIAYGQTGSGKTYSVLGKRPNCPGILQLCIHYLLQKLNENLSIIQKIELSAVEAFGKNVKKIELFDLCNEANLETQEWKAKQGSTMLDMKKTQRLPVDKYETALELVDKIHLASHFAPTGKNPKSSRGHVAFIIHVTMQEQREEEIFQLNGTDKATEAKNIRMRAPSGVQREAHYIVLDLAGSEGDAALADEFTKDMSKAEVTDRRLEAGCINHGLSEIQDIFGEMRKHKLQKAVGSGLRRTLHEYLNRNTFISVLFTLSPSNDNSMSTMSTLRFAETASLVKVTPVRAEKKINKDQLIRQLQEYLEKLQGVVANQKVAITQLQEQVVDLQQTTDDRNKTNTMDTIKEEKMNGVEAEHPTELSEQSHERANLSRRSYSNSTLMSVAAAAVAEADHVSEAIPKSLDDFLKKKYTSNDDFIDKSSDPITPNDTIGDDNENDKEWATQGANMRLSDEESKQLEAELQHEMSHERRMSRAQDTTLLQFVQSMQAQQPMIPEGGKESGSEEESDIDDDDKDQNQQEETVLEHAAVEPEQNDNNLQKESEQPRDQKVTENGKPQDSPTPVITDQDSDSEVSQLSGAQEKQKRRKKNGTKKEDKNHLSASNTKGKNKKDGETEEQEKELPSEIKAILEGKTKLDIESIQNVDLQQLSKASLILLFQKCNSEWKSMQNTVATPYSKVSLAPISTDKHPDHEINENEELPLMKNAESRRVADGPPEEETDPNELAIQKNLKGCCLVM